MNTDSSEQIATDFADRLTVYIGGPRDGEVCMMFGGATSSLLVLGGVHHCYRLDGTKENPVRDASGRRVMRHVKAILAKPCKPSDAS